MPTVVITLTSAQPASATRIGVLAEPAAGARERPRGVEARRGCSRARPPVRARVLAVARCAVVSGTKRAAVAIAAAFETR